MTRRRIALFVGCGWAAMLTALTIGCAYTPNYYRETGPSVAAPWDSPTASDIKARYEPAKPRQRAWAQTAVAPETGAVVHWPLYFEDPFVDKGHGRTDATTPHDVYHLGWEDWLAIPYGEARFTGNWLALPISAVVTPPWTAMESDGKLSQQLLGYDHDAIPLGRETATTTERTAGTPPQAESEAPQPTPAANASGSNS